MTFSINCGYYIMFSLGIKIFQTNIIKVLLKKCYGPALKAPSSDQSVRPSVRLSVRDLLSGAYFLSPSPIWLILYPHSAFE